MNVRAVALRSLQDFSLVLGVVFFAGCQRPEGVHVVERPAGYTMYSVAEAELCAHGHPELYSGAGHGPTTVISRPGYVLEYSATDKIARWVCETVRTTHLEGSADRTLSRFKPDPLLSSGARAELADYRNSEYDRGHMAPAADFKYDQQRTDESFFLSNVAPQIGPAYNRGIWRVLEKRIRDCVREHGRVGVITGGFFYDEEEESEDTADGYIAYSVIGENGVAVPTHFYKVLVARINGAEQALAFVLENAAHPWQSDADYDFAPFARSIDWLEDRAGIDFLPELDASAEEHRLEGEPGAVWACLQPGG